MSMQHGKLTIMNGDKAGDRDDPAKPENDSVVLIGNSQT